MSTLRVDNLQASDGLSPAFATSGVAKVTLSYDQVSVVIDESENVTSVTDTAAGDHTVNFTNDMGTATYSVSGTNEDDGAGGAYTSIHSVYTAGKAASSVRNYNCNSASTATDTVSHTQTFGDLA